MAYEKLKYNKELTKAIDSKGRKYLAIETLGCKGCIFDAPDWEGAEDNYCAHAKCLSGENTARMYGVIWVLRNT